MQQVCSKMSSFSFLAASTPTERNRDKWGQLWVPFLFPFPTRPWASSSYGFPLLHVYLSRGAKKYASSFFDFFLVIGRMTAEFQDGPRALVNSSQVSVLPGGLPWIMGLKSQVEWISPLCFIKSEKGSCSHPPMPTHTDLCGLSFSLAFSIREIVV